MRLSFQYCFSLTVLIGAFFLTTLLVAQDEDGGAGDPLPLPEKGVPRDQWVLDFKFQKLRMVTPRRGPGKGRTYWYMVYTLENKTGEDRDFFLSIIAESDRNKEYTDLFLPSVERAIELKEARDLWGKTDKFEILAKRDPKDRKYNYTTIRADENDKKKRYCVAVFNKLDRNANKITIRIAGLTNDIEELTDPNTGNISIQEKIRVLRFERAGDEYEISKDSLGLRGRDWEVRKLPVKTAGS